MTLSDFEKGSGMGHLSSCPGRVHSVSDVIVGAADSGRRVSRAINSHGNREIKMIQRSAAKALCQAVRSEDVSSMVSPWY